MADTNVIMPQMGESIFEGTITQWLKKVGDRVERDEPLLEISTDKIDSEIPSPIAGTLKQIVIGEGETVEINTVVAIISTDAADSEAGRTPDATPESTQAEPAVKTIGETPQTADSRSRIPSSPLVRRLAAENDIDLAQLADKGTGAGGRITKRDILSHIEQTKEGAAPAVPSGGDPDVQRVPMTAMRRAIAHHMVVSKQTSPHVATFFEVDCSAIVAARSALKGDFEKMGAHLTISPFFVHAIAQTIRKFPIVNSSVEGHEILMRNAIHVGVAVALDDGLLVPVIRNADTLEFGELARTMADLADRARNRKLLPEEVQEGTFTVTNPGNFGGLVGIPIINQPQVAILAIGGIEKRPVVVNDAIAIRPMVYLALSFDHRVIDGAVADQFMAEVKRTLEGWTA